VAELGDGLLRSHATTAGPALPRAQIRAMTVVRVEQIAVGRSGLGPATAAALVGMLNDDRMPVIGRFNSLGTGDVAPLARLALTLPVGALDAGDGLALMSSNALTIGRAALAVVDLDRLLAAATVVTALTFLARDGAAGALHPQAAGPFLGPQQVAGVLRRLGAGSRHAARLQDQYGLRAAPQTLGIAVDGAAALREVVTALTASGLENPLVLSGSAPSVVHHGGFHAVHLTAVLDGAALGLARAAVGSINRLALLTEPPPSGDEDGPPGTGAADLYRAFLAGGPATASGIMVLEYTAAAALGTVRAAALPAAAQTAGLSRGIEQDATYAPLAADQLEEAIAAARVLVAVELVAAIRAIRIRDLPVPRPLSQVWAVCQALPTEVSDRDLTQDVRDAEGLLDVIAAHGSGAGDD
jgi:histidine ammonia-lyase